MRFAISDLPVPDDMDADYSPQYVKLARILRARVMTGNLADSANLPACEVAAEYRVSVKVARAALDMLSANHYVTRPHGVRYYRVAGPTTCTGAQDDHELASSAPSPSVAIREAEMKDGAVSSSWHRGNVEDDRVDRRGQ